MARPAVTRAMLLDIEGTTTPLEFVRGTLFPHAEARLAAFCAAAGGDPRARAALEQLAAEHATERDRPCPAFGDGAPYARWLMRRDRKSTGLKAIQGLIWELGYRSGELRAPVFADVPRAFARWCAAGVRIRIYSSGSVLAQRLLFAHTDRGDLTGWIEGYHDTTTGPKTEARSYASIAAAMGLAPEQVLFLSDSVAELAAGSAAGLGVGWVERPGSVGPPAPPIPVYADFTSL